MKTKNERMYGRIIGTLLVVSIVFNLYQYNGKRHSINQAQNANRYQLQVVSDYSISISDRLEEFINTVSDLTQHEKIPEDIHSTWNSFLITSNSIDCQMRYVDRRFLEELEKEVMQLEYILSYVKYRLHSFNKKFLERSSYLLTAEETKQLELISIIYERVGDGIRVTQNQDIEFEQGLFDKLKESMLVLDPDYLKVLQSIQSIE